MQTLGSTRHAGRSRHLSDLTAVAMICRATCLGTLLDTLLGSPFQFSLLHKRCGFLIRMSL